MGREIRRVPLDWEHPKDEHGHYLPLYDRTYVAALAEWEVERDAFPSTEWAAKYTFEEWQGEAPDPAYYRPGSGDADLGWCVYETVSEGPPMSPVFSEPEALHRWLVEDQGYAADAAARFMVSGSAPSFVVEGGVIRDGIAAS